MKKSDDFWFDFINGVLLFLLTLIFLYPLYFVLIASVSEPYEVVNGNVIFWPKGLTLTAYANVFKEDAIWIGYRNSLIYTVFGTMYNLVLTIPAAYVLTKKHLPGRNLLAAYFFITMYFSGGMIPTYLVIKHLGLINSPWVMILGAGVSCWNLIVTRQFFSGTIPEALYEAASIDGANDYYMFFRIALPLATPIMAVMALFYAVGHWNGYYNALLYLRTSKLYPLQLVLRNILISNEMALVNAALDGDAEAMATAARKAYMAEAMKYALIFISATPLLCAYPFVQKYFVKGVMIGAVKG